MDKKLLAILAAAAAILAVTAWLAYPARPPEPAQADRRYMYCPTCEHEARYDPARYEKDCPFCGQKGPLIATKESIRKTGLPAGAVARLVPPLLTELTVLAAVLYFYASRRLRQVERENLLYMDCVRCGQRLRYKAERIDKVGQCPRCKRCFRFPPPAPDEDGPVWHWWQPQWWRSGKWREVFKRSD